VKVIFRGFFIGRNHESTERTQGAARLLDGEQ
jgi:hypothetical protein